MSTETQRQTATTEDDIQLTTGRSDRYVVFGIVAGHEGAKTPRPLKAAGNLATARSDAKILRRSYPRVVITDLVAGHRLVLEDSAYPKPRI